MAVYKGWREFDPGRNSPIDSRFASIPVLRKKDIREHFPQGMLPAGTDIDRAIASGEIDMVTTSGTTDDKVTNIWNQRWWNASERESWKLNSTLNQTATGDHREAILVES